MGFHRQPREDGTICPFGVFPLFYSKILPNFRSIPVMRPIAVSLRFPVFYRHFSWFWGLEIPNSPFVPFRPDNGLFTLPKNYFLKGELQILKQKYNKTGGEKQRQKDKWFHFHACTPPPSQTLQRERCQLGGNITAGMLLRGNDSTLTPPPPQMATLTPPPAVKTFPWQR